jgi:hypothetical protein
MRPLPVDDSGDIKFIVDKYLVPLLVRMLQVGLAIVR